jgi:hypothetical protein
MQEVSADDAQRHGVAVDDELTTDTSETKTSTTSSDQTASTKTLGVLSESPEIDKQVINSLSIFLLLFWSPQFFVKLNNYSY